jgi:transcriptional regulator with XRE-family HTH domain
MSQTRALVEALKQELKVQGLTYPKLANKLGISVATVKRMFSEANFTLDRLDQLCDLLAIDIAELAQLAEIRSRKLGELTDAQEKELVKDHKLLVVTFLVINGSSFAELLAVTQFDAHQLVRLLARLDRLKLISLLPNNRIKLLISPSFTWRNGGPIQNFFIERLRDEFLHSEFNKPNDVRSTVSGMLSEKSMRKLAESTHKLISEFQQLNRDDVHLSIAQRKSVSMIVAMRPWQTSVFDKFMRASNRKR